MNLLEYHVLLALAGGTLHGYAIAERVAAESGGALQPRAGSVQYIKTGTGDFCAALEVQDAQSRTQLPVWLGLEVKFGELSHRPQHDVFLVAGADRRTFIGNVWDGRCNRLKFSFRVRDFLIERADLIADFAHGSDLLLALCRIFGSANFFGNRVPFGF